uniref:Uncharacterized protein n=1 Tax=Branchiostoma floridae TaxID=7739 RepID=C3Z892_BRAFL|eukprot:XP_002595204.1 hypothetical protein BRAFLDRAFT_129340 [Branchiostoma floridae]
MKVSTMSALLLALFCCALLVEVATAADLSNLKTKQDVLNYMQKADDKTTAAKEIYDELVNQGKAKLANKFKKRAKSYSTPRSLCLMIIAELSRKTCGRKTPEGRYDQDLGEFVSEDLC